MQLTIRILDETFPGSPASLPLTFALDGTQVTTACALLELRIREEVSRYNQALPEVFQGLVQPEESERILNGFRMTTRQPLNADALLKRACASFVHQGFLLLVDGQQVTSLDEPLSLHDNSEVRFLKLVPLVGG